VAELRAAHDDTVGGPDKTIFAGAARHDPERVRVVPVYLIPPGDPMPALLKLAGESGARPVLVPDPDRWGRAAARTLTEIHARERFDVVHTHDVKSDFVGWRWAPRRGIALLATAHGWSRPQDVKLRAYNALDRKVLGRFPLVLAVSETIAAGLRRDGVPRVRVLPNGVDLDRWKPEAARERPVGLPPHGRLLGMVARLSEDKDFPALVNAFERIADNRGDVHLVVAGDGPGRPRLRERVDRSPHGSRIHLLGRRDDVPALLAAFDVFVLASRAEGMPNAVLEAMAARRPIVASAVGGVGELIRHEREGLLVPVGDPDALAAAVEGLLDDPGRAERLATAARARVEAEFSFAERVRRLEAIYGELVNPGAEGN